MTVPSYESEDRYGTSVVDRGCGVIRLSSLSAILSTLSPMP